MFQTLHSCILLVCIFTNVLIKTLLLLERKSLLNIKLFTRDRTPMALTVKTPANTANCVLAAVGVCSTILLLPQSLRFM